jgi:LEA14-like dessication related protein
MKRIATMAAVVALTACLPRVDQPEIWLAGARLSSLGLSGGTMDVELSVYNPNGFDLQASGLTYDLDLEDPSGTDWLDFTDGRLERALRVPSGDTVAVVVPVEFTYRNVSTAIRGLLEKGAFDYRVSGLVALEGPVTRDIAYRHRGTVTSGGVR